MRGCADLSNAGRNPWVTEMRPKTFVSNATRNCSRVAPLMSSPPGFTPALLTRMSSSPICCTAAAIDGGSVTSSCTTRAAGPSSFAACCPLSRSRTPIHTVTPWSSNCRAVSNPMPLLPPVTSATEPGSGEQTSAGRQSVFVIMPLSNSNDVVRTLPHGRVSPAVVPGRARTSRWVARIVETPACHFSVIVQVGLERCGGRLQPDCIGQGCRIGPRWGTGSDPVPSL